MLTLGYLLATGLYFSIALILCIGLQERRVREAFVLGIAAPALIASFASARGAAATDIPLASLRTLLPLSASYATTHEAEQISPFWAEFKRGLGFPVPDPSLLKERQKLLERVRSAEAREIGLAAQENASAQRIAALEARLAACDQRRLGEASTELKRAPAGCNTDSTAADAYDSRYLPAEAMNLVLLSNHLEAFNPNLANGLKALARDIAGGRSDYSKMISTIQLTNLSNLDAMSRCSTVTRRLQKAIDQAKANNSTPLGRLLFTPRRHLPADALALTVLGQASLAACAEVQPEVQEAFFLAAQVYERIYGTAWSRGADDDEPEEPGL